MSNDNTAPISKTPAPSVVPTSTGDYNKADTEGMAAFVAALGGDITGLKIEDPPVNDEPEGDEPPADEGKGKGRPAVKPKKLRELGAYAKLTDEELYGIEVPSAIEGADPYTIGKLKDLAKEHDEFTLNGLRREQEFRDREAAMLRTEQELRDLFAAIPENAIKPEVREQLKARRIKAERDERQRVLEVIPGWQDRDVRTRELGAMVEHLKDNGFPESYLASVLDHRSLRYIRNNMVRDQRIKEALEKVQKRKTSTPAKSTKSGNSPTKPTGNGSARSTTRDQRFVDNFESVLFANQQRS